MHVLYCMMLFRDELKKLYIKIDDVEPLSMVLRIPLNRVDMRLEE